MIVMQLVVDSREREKFLKLKEQVAASTRLSQARLKELLDGEPQPLDLFFEVKFSLLGYHPLQDRRLNLIEQVNQVWTFLASFRAVEVLWESHPDINRFRLNLGTKGGNDIEDLTDLPNGPAGLRIVGEVFAATVREGKKFSAERKKLLGRPAAWKYLFFFVPGEEPGRRPSLELGRADLRVWSLDQVAGDLGKFPG